MHNIIITFKPVLRLEIMIKTHIPRIEVKQFGQVESGTRRIPGHSLKGNSSDDLSKIVIAPNPYNYNDPKYERIWFYWR